MCNYSIAATVSKKIDSKSLTDLSVSKTEAAPLVIYVYKCLYFNKLMRKKEISLKGR